MNSTCLAGLYIGDALCDFQRAVRNQIPTRSLLLPALKEATFVNVSNLDLFSNFEHVTFNEQIYVYPW